MQNPHTLPHPSVLKPPRVFPRGHVSALNRRLVSSLFPSFSLHFPFIILIFCQPSASKRRFRVLEAATFHRTFPCRLADMLTDAIEGIDSTWYMIVSMIYVRTYGSIALLDLMLLDLSRYPCTSHLCANYRHQSQSQNSVQNSRTTL